MVPYNGSSSGSSRFDSSDLYADWRQAAQQNFERLLESNEQRDQDYRSEHASPELKRLGEETWQTYGNYLKALHSFISAADRVSVYPQESSRIEAFDEASSAVHNARGTWMKADKEFYDRYDAATRGAAGQSAVAQTVAPQSDRQPAPQAANRPAAAPDPNAGVAQVLAAQNFRAQGSRPQSSQPNGAPGQPYNRRIQPPLNGPKGPSK
ncbi:hypothetical protein [Streptomyces sp. NPDC006012]|uniref:hypothetical protein n=1 Tax=Streptomyces sp. NPDC006012 TaxID=3364739 RepID=UPI0036A68BFB